MLLLTGTVRRRFLGSARPWGADVRMTNKQTVNNQKITNMNKTITCKTSIKQKDNEMSA